MEQEIISQTLKMFNKLRLAGQLCDEVHVANDVKLDAHRIILFGCSPFFQAMFTGAWNVLGKREYKFPGISPETMKHIIEYAYTYSVLITVDNVESLLVAAEELNILGIVQCCSDFLLNQLCLENCVGLLKIADIYCLNQPHQYAFSSILKNFKEVVSTSEEFLELTLQQLCDIIVKEELNVRQEDVVFDAVLHWIQHKPASCKAHLLVLLPKGTLIIHCSH
ncbi:kelch-like protein 10 [Paramormyrops kingsleyae]|uniref:kelch-like protein 10 n=1 Tax=Paramormyrops kingsleyae TaxID=1676925 RepID=UPI003B96FCA8